MKKYILKNLILPLASRCTSNKGWDYYKHYIKADFDPVPLWRERQWQRLLNVLRHAYARVPFYRSKYEKAGVRLDDIKNEADFRRLPVITKKELRDNFPENVIADNFSLEFLRYSNTSGTTGSSLILVNDQDDINYKYASKLRSQYLMGCDIGDNIVRLTPNECQPCLPTGESPDVGFYKYLKMLLSRHKFKRQAYYIFLERYLINRFLNSRRFPPPLSPDLTDKELFNYVKVIQEFKPSIVTGYPVYLYLVAKYIQENRISMPKCKCIDLTAGLSSSYMRGFIGEQFSAPVFQSYGGCEFGRVASSCEHDAGRMHILEEQCYIEFIKNNGEPARQGQLANIIITALNAYGMPVIRYEHGDVGEYFEEGCACHRTTRLMQVAGRLHDLIITSDGKLVPSREILEQFQGRFGIKLFQLIQHSNGEVDFKYVKESAVVEINQDDIKMRLRMLLGDDVLINMQPLGFIQPAFSGKYRYVRSATYEPFRCVEDKKKALGNFW